MVRNSQLICKQIVKDLKNTFPYFTFQHVNIYRTQGRYKNANAFWKCKYCNFFLRTIRSILNRKAFVLFLHRDFIGGKNELKNNCIRRAQQHLIDLNR